MTLAKGNTNKNLNAAKAAKMDEFYTQMTDIEKEMGHYKDHFSGKTIFCNCDDPEESNFWKYFLLNFEHLGLKKLIATHYDKTLPTYKLEINGAGEIVRTPLKQNGDFRSQECVDILKEADIVVTNPPFSLFREYVAQLIEYEKKFIIIGPLSVLGRENFFGFIKENRIWIGYGFEGLAYFKNRENGKLVGFGNCTWFTNLDIKKRHEEILFYERYNEERYQKYDDYDAINVSKTKDIPMDYNGLMGVPISFLSRYNPEQFEILGTDRYFDDSPHYGNSLHINGREVFTRILIRNKKVQPS